MKWNLGLFLIGSIAVWWLFSAKRQSGNNAAFANILGQATAAGFGSSGGNQLNLGALDGLGNQFP